MSRLRVGFLGRGELGFRVLEGLLSNQEIDLSIVVTCPHSKEVGRSERDFQELAAQHGLVFSSTSQINTEEWHQRLNSLNLDLVVAMLWVNTVNAKIISTARQGFLNFHNGLLPRYRGNACLNWAILNEEESVGLTVHLMEADELDSGPILLQEELRLRPGIYISELQKEVIERGVANVLKAVELLRLGRAKPVQQRNSQKMYCYPRLPRDGEIDWTNSAESIQRLIRAAGEPYPGAYTFYSDVGENQRIKKMIIHKASIEEVPHQFSAVPGHLIRLKHKSGRNQYQWGITCGDFKLLILTDVQIGDRRGSPDQFFKTVRQRMGLDTETLLKALNIPFSDEVQQNH